MSKRDFQDISGSWMQTPGDGFEQLGQAKKRKRRSRWQADPDDKAILPSVIPAGLNREQEEQYIVQLQIEEISRRLRSGDLGIPLNPEERSPSPEPIYNNEGKRLNTREYRTRKKLEEDRHKLVIRAQELNTDYKPPPDYKPPVIRVNDKVMIPQEEHPDINFVGLLIGPRGNTLKNLEKETGAKIIIRGKGSVKEGKIGRKDGQPLPGEDEPLHAYVTANNPEHVKKAVEKIKEIIRQGIEVPEGQNDLRRQQLRELALLNGTLRENDALGKLKQIQQAQTIITNTILCSICGGTGHIAQDCKSKRPGDTYRAIQNQMQTTTAADRAKMDSEYMSLMAELGEGPPPVKPHNTSMSQPPMQTHAPPHRTPFSMPPPSVSVPPISTWQQPPPSNAAPPHGMNAIRPPPTMVGPPPSAQQVQPPINISGSQSMPMMGVPPPMSTSGGPLTMPPPWSQPPPPQPVSSSVPPPTVSMTTITVANNFRGPPPNLLAPPPPPPPNSQPGQFQHPTTTPQFPWQQQQQPQPQQQSQGPMQNFGPPPPPTNQSLPPWQQQPLPTTVAPVPPPPPSSIPPWQQQQQPQQPQQHMGPPQMPGQPPHSSNQIAPPPPPPGGQTGFNMIEPPPPPPGGDMRNMGMPGSIPLGVPPPPPPN